MTRFAQLLIIALVVVLALAVANIYYLRDAGEQDSVQDALALESGISLFRDKKYQQAFEMLRGIPVDSPLEWRAKYYQGSSLVMLENYEDAVVYLEQAYALNDQETQIMHALGLAYFKLGNLKMSKGYFASILEIDPFDEEASGLMDMITNMERQSQGNGAGNLWIKDADEVGDKGIDGK